LQKNLYFPATVDFPRRRIFVFPDPPTNNPAAPPGPKFPRIGGHSSWPSPVIVGKKFPGGARGGNLCKPGPKTRGNVVPGDGEPPPRHSPGNSVALGGFFFVAPVCSRVGGPGEDLGGFLVGGLTARGFSPQCLPDFPRFS